MKKRLESELMSIAHKVLKLKGKEDVIKMHTEVAALYEKLTVLKFAQENFEDELPSIGDSASFFGMLGTAFTDKVSDNIEIDNKTYINVDVREEEELMEPVTEKIKDMVAEMPPEAQDIEAIFEAIQPKRHKNDFEEITADFAETPIFYKLSDVIAAEKQSLNDKLKSGGLTIGLNDKLAFIKHLFEGESDDYGRVISQLNTMSNFKEADNFINNNVKPDYNSWEDKEEYVERFMEIISARFN